MGQYADPEPLCRVLRDSCSCTETPNQPQMIQNKNMSEANATVREPYKELF
jgi:hypothetical protein